MRQNARQIRERKFYPKFRIVGGLRIPFICSKLRNQWARDIEPLKRDNEFRLLYGVSGDVNFIPLNREP